MLGFGSRTGRTSRTGQTSPICPRTNTDLCSFAPFVLLRGLKLSTDFLLFPSHKATFLCADFLIASAGTIRLSADSIRKPADTIRKLTKRVKKLFTKNTRKERDFLIKSAPLAGFRTTFPFQGSKKGSQNSADGAERRFSQGFRETAPVKFSEYFRSYRISPTSLTLRKGYCRFCLSDSMRAKSLSTASSSAIFFSTHTLPR